MNGKMRSSVMGLILSLFSSPLPEVQKEPVAYLYNGVRLPALPEWDRVKYPYAVIIYSPLFGIAQWKLYVGSEIIYRQVASGYQVGFSTCKTWTTTGGGWTAGEDKAEETYIVTVGSSSLKWSNFDVLNEDGSAYLSASEPIPVYE